MSIRTRCAPETRRGALVALSLAALAPVGHARAHPQAAQTPVFDTQQECISVVDKRATQTLALRYSLPFDDTEITFGDIPVTDAKTHQFFAFSAAVHPAALQIEAYPFDATRAAHVIPEWISVDDVMRSAQASPRAQGVVFDGSEVPSNTVLENDVSLTGLWRAITTAQQRVPITIAQANRGANWDLTTVPRGVYTVAGYVFSPPYNGWSIRPQLVKVVDGSAEPAALIVSPIDEFVFQYQGRRVGLCAHVPDATRMSAYFHVVNQAAGSWTAFAQDQPISSGRSELCFRAPAGVTGDVRLRFDLLAPDGSTATFYSPNALTALQGEGQCAARDTICCDFTPSGSGATAGGGPAMGGAGGVGAIASAPAPEASSGACRVSSGAGPEWSNAGLGLAVLSLLTSIRRRRNP